MSRQAAWPERPEGFRVHAPAMRPKGIDAGSLFRTRRYRMLGARKKKELRRLARVESESEAVESEAELRRKAREDAGWQPEEEIDCSAEMENGFMAKEVTERRSMEEAKRNATGEAARMAKEEFVGKATEGAERRAMEDAKCYAKAERTGNEDVARKSKELTERMANKEAELAERIAQEEARRRERTAKEDFVREAKKGIARTDAAEGQRRTEDEAESVAEVEREKLKELRKALEERQKRLLVLTAASPPESRPPLVESLAPQRASTAPAPEDDERAAPDGGRSRSTDGPAAPAGKGAPARGPDGELWRVRGGRCTGGIVVRNGSSLRAQELPERLATGAILKQIKVTDGRLNYRKVQGNGPDWGWVSIETKAGVTLVEPFTG